MSKDTSDTDENRYWFMRYAMRMQSPVFCLIATLLSSLAVAIVLTLVINPLPKVHDEFSYLLAADAFSQFKTSAETHPHWQHFESFHVIHQPRYASKYPPGQGFFLAIGKLVGHPIIGAIAATSLSVVALMWMLLGWIPAKTNWFVSLLLSTHPGIQILWGQTYMGGALAMSGGALLLGAFFRLDSQFKIAHAFIAGLGISLLMFSRPLEGAILTATVLLVLLFRLIRLTDWKFLPFVKRVLIPAASVIVIAVSTLATYNYSITHHASELPYKIYEKQYGWVPLFLWQQPPADPPTYRHGAIRDFYSDDFDKRQTDYATVFQGIKQKWKFIWEAEYFFFGSSLVFAIFAFPLLLKESKYQLAAIVVAPALIAGFITPWGHTHYLAPAGSVILLFGFSGLIYGWQNLNLSSNRRSLVTIVLLAHCFWFGKELYNTKAKYHRNWWVRRDEIRKQLETQAGKDLVFVRYGQQHIPHQEWVYNGIDLDGSEVVWAREMSPLENSKLISYFADRNVWLVEPENQRKLTPLRETMSEISY